jgi:hypothetical protein
VLRHERFEDRRHRVTLEPGTTRSIETVIVARDPEDPETLRILGEELQVALRDYEPERLRGGTRGAPELDGVRTAKTWDRPPVRVLFPRDTVRLEDLGMARVELADVMYEPAGTIRILRGEEILHEAPYDPEDVVTELRIPAAVREAVRPGEELIWGYFPRVGQPVTATFRLLGREEHDEICQRLEAIEERLEGQPEALVGHLRTQFLLNEGLDSAALLEARRLCERSADSIRGWAALNEAVRRLDLGGTRLGREVRGHLRRLRAEAPEGAAEVR